LIFEKYAGQAERDEAIFIITH